MVYISVAEAAERWQLSERRVQKFARRAHSRGEKIQRQLGHSRGCCAPTGSAKI